MLFVLFVRRIVWFNLLSILSTTAFSGQPSLNLPKEGLEKMVPEDQRSDVSQIKGLSCYDVLTTGLPVPNDPDVNLIYLNAYTFCMIEFVLKTYLNFRASRKLGNLPEIEKEITEALDFLSGFLPMLLMACKAGYVSFKNGLRAELNSKQLKAQKKRSMTGQTMGWDNE